MTNPSLNDLRFPIGPFEFPTSYSKAEVDNWIQDIKLFPQLVKESLEEATVEQLNWPYRPGGWKIKQVVHHCGDSHMNAWIRFKLTLTESSPAIRPYLEARWAETADSIVDNITDSLDLLTALHAKWTLLLDSLSESDWAKRYYHPEHEIYFDLGQGLANYAWHCRHHLAHIKHALSSGGKYVGQE